jgi:CubicO group peptidase (beta-lactamase class C family)
MEYLRHDVAGPERNYPIEGYCSTQFSAVADRFAENFAAGREVGASLAVTHRGALVVDLWGGYTNASFARRWRHDTIVNMMSVSKAISAIALFLLVERGQIDPDAPVSRYWPEFAAGGKGELPLGYVLDHRAGLPWISEDLPRGTAYDARAMADALARQAPLFTPGDDPAYHVLSQGYIVAELVRRVTGESLGSFFRREISAPLHIDYNIGLLPEELERCADFVLPPDAGLRKGLENPQTPDGMYWKELAAGEEFNSLAFRTAEIPSANGHGNGRAVALLYGRLAQVLKRATIDRLRAERHHIVDRIRPRHYHQASGVVRNSPPVAYMGPNPAAFGHQGAGGAIGFGDPENEIGFGYGMNYYAPSGEAERRAPLIDATYEALR